MYTHKSISNHGKRVGDGNPHPPSPSKKQSRCQYKVAYPNEQWARAALDLISHRPKGGKGPRKYCYYCERCSLWHITSMSQEVWQAEPAKRRNHHRLG